MNDRWLWLDNGCDVISALVELHGRFSVTACSCSILVIADGKKCKLVKISRLKRKIPSHLNPLWAMSSLAALAKAKLTKPGMS